MVQTAWMWPIRRCSELFPVPEAEAHALRELERTVALARWQERRDPENGVWQPGTTYAYGRTMSQLVWDLYGQRRVRLVEHVVPPVGQRVELS